jgi:ribosomal protein S18 acetylase RimI-like enzyme
MESGVHQMFSIVDASDSGSATVRQQVRDIFFAGSDRKVFESTAAKDAFFRRWTDPYFEARDSRLLLAKDGETILGYLMGAFDSHAMVPSFERTIPSYLAFQDLFDRFPAHLHINVSPSFQARGIGASLVDRFCAELKRKGIRGVHAVSSTGQRNLDFYRRNGFAFEEQRLFGRFALLFLGRVLENEEKQTPA